MRDVEGIVWRPEPIFRRVGCRYAVLSYVQRSSIGFCDHKRAIVGIARTVRASERLR